ncbi:uncharacterized protein K452DRAFT_270195 [Aplosporella prunicola CBS 121167]|uniref:AAA+ ATPase domain-containing protein n=1 Tax=Aplosporella prunicola CBS 121167 TaxID=1176127 RepID=A0A6A6BGU8_9PEZI|nr:uncharacterized protein K452DRAFT_270195 [Aplosporella prunicola CBS 121167]KAF2142504.1 hypothetical protein K452DRAFT_270195 [Aplosporella prunicola CBS 121167]
MATQGARGVTITNPLVLYRALLATNRIRPDPAQHRLAIHLQKLYDSLKDYEPTTEYSHRLQQISRAVGQDRAKSLDSGSIWSSVLSRKEKNNLALTRVFTSHEEALHLDSPKGLLLHGEVGTGKSLLIDLFAESLPNRKKKRVHFSIFMLEVLAQLEQLRRRRSVGKGLDDEHSLLWLARDMIQNSPILFVDEFQLPDRASSKILANLLTPFFQLGGVLIATSNRMPEELAKASGVEFAPPPSALDSLRWRFGLRGRGNMLGGKGDFGPFLEVLKARCEVWELGSGRDYRRESDADVTVSAASEAAREAAGEACTAGPGIWLPDLAEPAPSKSNTLPKKYYVKPSPTAPASDHETWLKNFHEAERQATGQALPTPWAPSVMRVFGRQVHVPRQSQGVTLWTFSELCNTHQLGPADYITLASTFHTLILTDVPVLTLLQKNEARRFITLLDALYEARCKLIITAAGGPDDIFFPEAQRPATEGAEKEQVNEDVIHSETFAEAYQDTVAPFRPNISSYEGSADDREPEPDLTHARLQGILAEDALEDDPPNRVRRGIASSSEEPRQDIGAARHAPNFQQTGAFTGEDERFAYKRARSRLWEMCSNRWWARNEEGWWRPVAKEVRRWESSVAEREREALVNSRTEGIDAKMGSASDIDEKKDEVLFRHGASPFRTHSEPPPKISWVHIWGTGVTWGKKAGAWGAGIAGLEQRKKEKEERHEKDSPSK